MGWGIPVGDVARLGVRIQRRDGGEIPLWGRRPDGELMRGVREEDGEVVA